MVHTCHLHPVSYFNRWLLLTVFLFIAFSADARRARPDYEPPDPPGTTSGEAWTSIPPGWHGAVGTIDTRYARHLPPDLDPTLRQWSGTAWRGERVAAPFVLWSVDAQEQVRLEASEFRTTDGRTLRSGSVRPIIVRYVLADTTLQGDILDTAERINTPARSTRPIWVQIDVPRDAGPGRYTGTVTARSATSAPVVFSLALEVLPLRLPAAKDWSFYLDLWQNPYAVARYHHVEPFSPEHLRLLEPHLRMLAEAGQKVLTTTIIFDPWGGQTFDSYDTMVQWIRKPDGTWRYDYTLFDRYVRFAESCGYTGAIHCYSMIPWTNRVRYRDEATGSDAWLTLEYDKPSYDAIWKPFLQDFVKHLREKKLLGRVRIAMDERPEALMRPAMAVLRQYAPEIGLALAGSNEPGLKNDIDDWCVYLEPSLDTAIARERRERGVVTTFYTCTGPEQPNTFTYSPPAEAAWLPIYAAARDYDGYLRWAYDSWTEDPLHDTKHVSWQAGDAFLIYPGARSSIRFERLREGIQEFEKIRILRSNAAIANSTERKALDAALAKMTIEDVRARPAAQPVGEAKAAILALSRAAAR